MRQRLEALGRRWPWFGRALEVHTRVGEVNGSAVASAVTLTTFVSLFPLALVLIALVGFLAAGDVDVPDRIIDALSLEGQAATAVREAIATAEASRRTASVVGLLGLAWAGLNVPAAIALAVQAPWQQKVAGIRTKLEGVLWLLGAAVLSGVSIGLGAVLGLVPDWAPVPISAVLLVTAGLAAEVAFFLWTFWMLGDRRAGWQAFLPGAVLGAVGLEVLKLLATVLLPRLIAGSSSLYGPLGVVFAILAWLMLFARLLVYSSTLNAVQQEQRAGTLTLEIQVPRIEGIDGEPPVEADRGGAAVAPEPATTD